MKRFADQMVAITGASSGIGAALAQSFAARGARVALAARRPGRLAQTAALCAGEPLIVPCDVTKATDRHRLIESVMDRWGGIDVLVNNAGAGLYSPFAEVKERDLRALLEVDFVAVFQMTQEALPVMRQRGRGAIVNVASTGGLVAHAPNVSAYLAAKHAVVGMSRGLRRELEGTGISVQVVCPHLTKTDFFSVGVGAEAMQELVQELADRMDTAAEVAEGTVEQIGDEPFVIFPTERSRRVYERLREAAW